MYKFVQQSRRESSKNSLSTWNGDHFYLRDLPILMDINEEVREVSNQNGLNRAQTRALKKLKDVSPEEFQRVTDNVEASSKTAIMPDGKKSAQIDLKDLSGREIEGLAEKAAKRERLAELNRPRVSPSFKQEPAILMMCRRGIPVEGIAARLKINRKTAKKYSESPRLIRSLKKSLKKGDACHKVAEEFGCPEPLVWSIALEGKSDLDRFKALKWGLRTWDLWSWNDCDKRLGISGGLFCAGTPERQKEHRDGIYQCRLARFPKHPCQK